MTELTPPDHIDLPMVIPCTERALRLSTGGWGILRNGM